MKFALFSAVLLSAAASSALAEDCSDWANEKTGPLVSITRGEDNKLAFCCREEDGVVGEAGAQRCCGGKRANVQRLTYSLYTKDGQGTTTAAVPLMTCKADGGSVAAASSVAAQSKPTTLCDKWGASLLTVRDQQGIPDFCCPAPNVQRDPTTGRRKCVATANQMAVGLLPAINAIQEGLYVAPASEPEASMTLPLQMFAEMGMSSSEVNAAWISRSNNVSPSESATLWLSGNACSKDLDCGPDALCKANKCFTFSGGNRETCNVGTFAKPTNSNYCGDGLSCNPDASGTTGTCGSVPMGMPCSSSLSCAEDDTGLQGQCTPMEAGSLPVCQVDNRHLRLRRRV
jgi:hypothetical protein